MDYKYHLERVLDDTQTIREHAGAIKEARKALFLEKNKAMIHDIIRNKDVYLIKDSKIHAIKEISNDYDLRMIDAMNIVNHLEWFE